MKHLFLIAVLLLSSTTAFSAYYFHSGEMEVIGKDVDVLDYPDTRASAVHKFKKGEIISVQPTVGQTVGSHAFLSKLFQPTSNWMAVRMPSGQIGFCLYSDTEFRQISSNNKLKTTDGEISAAHNAGKEKYARQAKTGLKWLGFLLLGISVLVLIHKFTENAFISLTAGFGVLALIVALGLYLWNNPHSMWFVSPTINGWGNTLLCIIPTIGISTVIVGEFIGALCGMFRNLVNLLYALLLGSIVFLICRAVYLEVMDLVALMILSLSGAVFRSSSDTGTLIDRTTGEFISGVTFSGNKAYSGNKTFTNDGSGFFE